MALTPHTSKKRSVSELTGVALVDDAPGHLVLPAFPLCIGRNLIDGSEISPALFFVPGHHPGVRATKNPGASRGFVVLGTEAQAAGSPPGSQADLASRRRAVCWKNSAWLMTAETLAGWNGLAMRKAGSGRSPVRKRSG
ncbi:hypothetical protein AFCDBAGC_2238 [Methylobacterium cerastii]|uniref:Uncharacterized protein n=1 Tax=Methylobacterium cerastii TaxID=932741 RepID=A0ABQ4QGI5_9HYPH|nr:hypothetical protein AFCDBAGC_2238 [Methylobacterium cerastii]